MAAVSWEQDVSPVARRDGERILNSAAAPYGGLVVAKKKKVAKKKAAPKKKSAKKKVKKKAAKKKTAKK
ncbi:MAG: hypothetical protein AAGJ46_18845, partial [Planctomycetota bacterium]